MSLADTSHVLVVHGVCDDNVEVFDGSSSGSMRGLMLVKKVGPLPWPLCPRLFALATLLLPLCPRTGPAASSGSVAEPFRWRESTCGAPMFVFCLFFVLGAVLAA